MVLLSEILDALKAWPTWKRLTEMPEKMAELERRIAALEKTPSKAPGKACPSCGALAFRLVASRRNTLMGDLGAVDRDYQCGECSFKETREADD